MNKIRRSKKSAIKTRNRNKKPTTSDQKPVASDKRPMRNTSQLATHGDLIKDVTIAQLDL
jgi:hypothetical protein